MLLCYLLQLSQYSSILYHVTLYTFYTLSQKWLTSPDSTVIPLFSCQSASESRQSQDKRWKAWPFCHMWLNSMCTHTQKLWVHRNPHVVSPSCQEPICLHYHHMARGSRSVRAGGNCNTSLSGNKTKKNKAHVLDVCHVTASQDRGH